MSKHEIDDFDTDIPTPMSAASAKHEATKTSHLSREALETQLAEMTAQLNEANLIVTEHKNQLLRSHAELDNIRKRAEKDVQNAHKYGLERLLLALLPIVDSLERGIHIEVGDNDFAKQLHTGLEMTLSMFMDTLEKFSIKPVDPLDQPFDPALHQAISTQENAGAPANTVLQVLQKGYLLNERLIRPALVVVAK